MSLQLQPHEVEAWDRFAAASMAGTVSHDPSTKTDLLVQWAAADADAAILARRTRLPAPGAVAKGTWRLLDEGDAVVRGDEWLTAYNPNVIGHQPVWEPVPAHAIGEPFSPTERPLTRRRVKP